MDTDTPITNAAQEATHNPSYEFVGAEEEAWKCARELERELNAVKAENIKLDDALFQKEKELDTVEAARAMLQMENAELLKEKARFDGSEEFKPDIFYEVTHPETQNEAKLPGFFVCFDAGGWVEEKNLRQAIDAAMEAKQ